MNKLILLITAALLVVSVNEAFAQKKKKPCKNLFADLEAGTINKVKASQPMNVVKKKLPCFTGDSEEGGSMNCGGGVFYIDNDFFFYTGRDYIEIRSDYNGQLSDDVMGKDKSIIHSKYGEPDRKLKGSEGEVLLYKKKYGTLRLYFGEDGRVMEIGMHAVNPKSVEFCE
jgi:hypothetical protein